MRPSSRALAILALLVAIAAVDRGIGVAMKWLMARTFLDNVCAAVVPGALHTPGLDVVVFGSSRAKYHFDPAVFEESWGLRAYNAGCNGQGCYAAHVIESILLQRATTARLFILQVDPKDLYLTEPTRSFALAPLVDEPGAAPFVRRDLDFVARLKLQSWSYRYNSIALRLLAAWALGHTPPPMGFQPADGTMVGKRRWEKHPGGIPLEVVAQGTGILQEKEKHFREFVREAHGRGVAVAWVLGPRLRNGQPRYEAELRALARIEQLASEEDVPFLHLDENSHPILDDPRLYKDNSHLNREGAVLFSRLLLEELPTAMADWPFGTPVARGTLP